MTTGTIHCWTWRRAIIHSDLSPTTRHVLLTLSCFMNEAGESAFPSTKTLSKCTGLSERAIITHLDTAKQKGWIVISKHGSTGKGWARNEYSSVIPDDFRAERGSVPSNDIEDGAELGSVGSIHEEDGAESLSVPNNEGAESGSARNDMALNVVADGTERGSAKALNVVQSNSPINSPNTTTTPKPPPPEPPASETGDAVSGCGGGDVEIEKEEKQQSPYIWPVKFGDTEKRQAEKMLAPYPDQAQDMLDELAARMLTKEIKSPISYLRSLTKRAKEGLFEIEAGIPFRENREKRRKMDQAIAERDRQEKARIAKAREQANSGPGLKGLSEHLSGLKAAIGRKG